MGMFDTVRTSYPVFGDERDLTPFQTKDLACIMADYWISPEGQLFQIDYSGTADIYEVPPEDRQHPLSAFKWLPNGSHGRVRACSVWSLVSVYPSRYEPGNTRILVIEGGQVVDVRRSDE